MLKTIQTGARSSVEACLLQSILKLSGQYGPQARIRIEHNLVRGWKPRPPVEREPVRATGIINLDDISFVVVENDTCVRIGVGERLLTASGENAMKLLAWARTCGQRKVKTLIPLIPGDIMFDRSVFNVCVRDGELAFA